MLTRPKRLKPFLLILSYKKSQCRGTHFEYLRSHLNIQDFYYYYFIGDLTIENEYQLDEANKIVYLKVPDNYESLSLKVYYAFKFINDNFKNKIGGVFKTDDDIQLDLDSIMKLYYENFNLDYFGILNKTISNFSDYHFGKCENSTIDKLQMPIPIDVNYCSGGGYYVKYNNIPKILQSIKNFNSIIFEDLCVGKTLVDSGIIPLHVDMKNNGFFW